MKRFTPRHLTLALCQLLLLCPLAYATGMKPETAAVLIKEADGITSMKVTNTDSTPALLQTKVLSIPEDNEPLLIATPALVRINGGDKQLVRFLLQNKTPLTTQRLRRIEFSGVPGQLKNDVSSKINVAVGQNIPAIIHPKGLAEDQQPWTHLRWSLDGSTLQLKNPSPYVVRLHPSVTLLPQASTTTLPKAYVLPGEMVEVILAQAPQGEVTALEIDPVYLYGSIAKRYSITHESARVQ